MEHHNTKILPTAPAPDFVVKFTSKKKVLKQWHLHRELLKQTLPYYKQWFEGPFSDNGESVLEDEFVGSIEGVDFLFAWLYNRNAPASLSDLCSQIHRVFDNCPRKPGHPKCDVSIKDCEDILQQALTALQPIDFFCADDVRKELLAQIWKLVHEANHSSHTGKEALYMTTLPIIFRFRRQYVSVLNDPELLDSEKHLKNALALKVELWKKPVALYEDELRNELVAAIPTDFESFLKLRKLRDLTKNSAIKAQWNELLTQAELSIAKRAPFKVNPGGPTFMEGKTQYLLLQNVDRNDMLEFLRLLSTTKRDGGILDLGNCEEVWNLLSAMTVDFMVFSTPIGEENSHRAQFVSEEMKRQGLETLPELKELRRYVRQVEDYLENAWMLKGDKRVLERMVPR